MQDYEREWMPYMQTMGIPNQMYPMVTMSEHHLERMYPRVYYIIYPEVVRYCDMMDMTYGSMHIPTPEEIKRITDDISVKVEVDVEVAIKKDSRESEERQLGLVGRGLLRSLIGILLLRELLRRRRRPFFGFPFGAGFGPGFGAGFGPGF